VPIARLLWKNGEDDFSAVWGGPAAASAAGGHRDAIFAVAVWNLDSSVLDCSFSQRGLRAFFFG